MRWERGQDPATTWTTLDNRVVDADLSCRALGLLTRWLRRPPGVEIDSIPEMIKRAKRDGVSRMEGRDALYAASYELEEAGFLVREQTTNALGQHEWVVRIYALPVPPDKRSKPEGRKRTSSGRKRAGAAKPQVSPITGFQESGFQESGSPDSGNPDSGNQGFSSKDSLNDSSLSGAGASQQPQDERESSAPRNDQQQPAEAGVPGQRQDGMAEAPAPAAAASAGTERDDQAAAVAENFAASLPGRLGRTTVRRLAPLVAAALADGYTPETLRAELAELVDVSRIINRAAVPGLYERALSDLPPAPTTASQQPGAVPPGTRAALIAACGQCDEYGQYEDDRSRVGRCSHPDVDREQLAA